MSGNENASPCVLVFLCLLDWFSPLSYSYEPCYCRISVYLIDCQSPEIVQIPLNMKSLASQPWICLILTSRNPSMPSFLCWWSITVLMSLRITCFPGIFDEFFTCKSLYLKSYSNFKTNILKVKKWYAC